jgi:hypothetical protein
MIVVVVLVLIVQLRVARVVLWGPTAPLLMAVTNLSRPLASTLLNPPLSAFAKSPRQLLPTARAL